MKKRFQIRKFVSIVELVLFACETTEDALEIDDLVEGAIRAGAARVLPREQDPFLVPTRG